MPINPIYATYDWKENRGVEKFKFCPLCGERLAPGQVAHKSRPVCPGCGFIYFRNPAPTVSVLVMRDRQVLLGKRLGEPGQGKWALPSGYIEFEDDFMATAAQEVKEETGLEVEIKSVLHVQSAFLPPDLHFLTVFLLAQVLGGQLQAGDDLGEVGWFSLSGPLPEMAFRPDVELIRACSQVPVGVNLQFQGIPMTRSSSENNSLTGRVRLHKVKKADLPIFFEHEQDPQAIHMAAFTAKDPSDRAAFMAHWAKILADPGIILRTILCDGRVAGSVVCHGWFGDPEISYWLGREFWGQGIATFALAAFLRLVKVRPLYARAVKDNFGSLRVLEKCGFKVTGEGRGFAHGRGMEVEEWVLKLEAGA
jgi:RimJ/RimL family protein N-acetyltransferase/8-oxo-dGTP pyrophosphatase MutT (NUDIX family)